MSNHIIAVLGSNRKRGIINQVVDVIHEAAKEEGEKIFYRCLQVKIRKNPISIFSSSFFYYRNNCIPLICAYIKMFTSLQVAGIKLLNIVFAVSVIFAFPLFAQDSEKNKLFEIPEIIIEATKLTDVSGEQLKSADLAEALSKNVPNISLVRRSGIANDILLRGQKRDNLNILVDGAKICGACPNRMDPPTSHIIVDNIDGIEIIEGPFDVENFGTLSGAVKINTRKPKSGLHGRADLNIGQYDYRKGAATINGGIDSIKALVSVSGEKGGQYKDGNGNNLSEQMDNILASSNTQRYKDEYKNADAFEKKVSIMSKLFFDITDNRKLSLSYTGNRSSNILYPNSPMDAVSDNSDILNLNYSIKNLGYFSKAVDLGYYFSRVAHPMSNKFRVNSGSDAINEKISTLSTDMHGLKLINTVGLDHGSELKFGIDSSIRNWNGKYQGKGSQLPIDGLLSIDDVNTQNIAAFAELNKKYDSLNLKIGARFDHTEIEPGDSFNEPSNYYNSVNGFIYGNYKLNNFFSIFSGAGRSTRVPDARELYFHGSNIVDGNPVNPQSGTPDLNQTRNTEVDLGFKTTSSLLKFKTKVFYSRLNDYIYYNSNKTINNFENIDASIYGMDLSGSIIATEKFYLDFGMAYQRGRKDDPLEGQKDKDLADIPPLKGTSSVNYNYIKNLSACIELVAAPSWYNYDKDNGEQHLDGYAIVNIKLKQQIINGLLLTAGADNVFNETYTVSNTYKDLTLLSDGTGNVMLLNEPGRYFYINATYSF
jgi:iron complex outermembrane recepter protein